MSLILLTVTMGQITSALFVFLGAHGVTLVLFYLQLQGPLLRCRMPRIQFHPITNEPYVAFLDRVIASGTGRFKCHAFLMAVIGVM